MNIPLIDLTIQHRNLRTEINTAFQSVLDRADFNVGQDVMKLEEEFCDYCGVKYAIGVDSGSSALELSLRALGIGPGAEVLVPAHTFTATAAAVTYTGAKPVFVDVDPETWNIDVTKIEAAITPYTKAILPVHLYGLPADMHMLLGIAEKYNLVVVEDACQAPGAKYKGYFTGSFGNAAGFSFFPTQNLGACGDGGMVTTNDVVVARYVRAARNCVQNVKNIHELTPFNHRLENLQAAILRVKLHYLDQWIESRRKLAALYHRLLAETNAVKPAEPPGYRHVYHFYVIRVQNPDALQTHLKEHGICTAVRYPCPLPLQPFYAKSGYTKGQFPVAEKICDQILSLPIYPEMTEEQVEIVASEINNELTLTTELGGNQ
jgi:dTDP-4-amino-4,6-dideoxygalactose transaminase